MQVRLVRQVWEYSAVVLAAGANPAVVLGAAGEAGWETTGIVVVRANGTTVLLKRPR